MADECHLREKNMTGAIFLFNYMALHIENCVNVFDWMRVIKSPITLKLGSLKLKTEI